MPYHNTTVAIEINYLEGIFHYMNYTPTISLLVSSVIIFISAVKFNAICIKYDIIYILSYLPAYFFVLLNSLFVDQLYAGPVLIVNLLLILSFEQILSLYNAENTVMAVFIASFYAGISVLLNISYLLFFVYLLIGLNIFRPFNIRDNIAAILSFLVPIYIGTMVNYLINSSFLPFRMFYPDYGSLNTNQYWIFQTAIPAIMLVSLIAIFQIHKNFFRNSTNAKRTLQLLLVLLFVAILLIITGKQNFKQEFSFLSIPLSIYFAYYFTTRRINMLKEVINLLLLIAILFFQYF